MGSSVYLNPTVYLTLTVKRIQTILAIARFYCNTSHGFRAGANAVTPSKHRYTDQGWGRGGGELDIHAWPQSHDHRPSHPYYAGTESVGFSSPTRQTLLAPQHEAP